LLVLIHNLLFIWWINIFFFNILQCTDEEIEQSYEEFYEDVHTEFLKFGELVNFKVIFSLPFFFLILLDFLSANVFICRKHYGISSLHSNCYIQIIFVVLLRVLMKGDTMAMLRITLWFS
jgi:hypothetical protein